MAWRIVELVCEVIVSGGFIKLFLVLGETQEGSANTTNNRIKKMITVWIIQHKRNWGLKIVSKEVLDEDTDQL